MNVMNSPRSVEIAITDRCNLRCHYCSHFTSASDVDVDLAKEEWLTFFGELNRLNVLSVTLQGGEPFYRADLPELIEGIAANRMRFRILSNGTLIDDDTAAFLAATGRCDGVQVSVDGSNASTHDASRGKGSFDRAIAGIEALLKNGIPVPVRVTVNRRNVGHIEEIAAFL
ncbi:MAG TPA: radical SAM protein, partial [Bacteroidetes bacterium]|nr:radical SAM protein [Bacteroidota bacterium]